MSCGNGDGLGKLSVAFGVGLALIGTTEELDEHPAINTAINAGRRPNRARSLLLKFWARRRTRTDKAYRMRCIQANALFVRKGARQLMLGPPAGQSGECAFLIHSFVELRGSREERANQCRIIKSDFDRIKHARQIVSAMIPRGYVGTG